MPRTVNFGLAIFLGAAPLAAQDPAQNGPLACRVAEGDVHLSWNIQFFRAIAGWVIARDGEPIASLDPSAASYVDLSPPEGERQYLLSALSLEGSVDPMGECLVTVIPSRLRCRVDGQTVHLNWADPLWDPPHIEEFIIIRNGEAIGTVPPTEFSHRDDVPTVGDYRYQVIAVTGPVAGIADASFLVGTCGVTVECFGLSHKVEGLDVHLMWPVPIPAIPIEFTLFRDGQLIARTSGGEHKDTVPSPGTYLYELYWQNVLPDARPFLAGACRITVPGDMLLPPPEDLACQVLDVQPLPPVNTPLPLTLVGLSWTNPVPYDKVIIARNGMVIATLEGSETRFVDRVVGGGIFAYRVMGTRGNLVSRAAECRVEVPPLEVPPPQHFTCSLNDIIVDPTDPDAQNSGVVVRPDGSIAPFLAVVLRWMNPVRYRGLVVLRDGAEIAKLPGDAMVYRDIAPPAGRHVYGIYGLLFDGRRSVTVECEVFVGAPVPPVEDLVCGVQEKAVEDTVDLAWTNPVRYDAIAISRNGEGLARLPGDATSYRDLGLQPGVYLYEVVAIIGNGRSPPFACLALVSGPPAGNILFFSSGLLSADPAGLPPDQTLPGSRLTCLLQNGQDVQGWSFGVQSDPKFVVPARHDLAGTVTAALNGGAGPVFLSVELAPDGLTMGVVIDDAAPFETLPPGRSQALINIEYEAGPSGAHGEVYPVNYSGTLGDPPVQVLLVIDGFESRPRTLPGRVTIPGLRFLRADANGDGRVNISDPQAILGWLFLGDARPGCRESADVNGSRSVNVADPIYLLSHLFNGGPAPPRPYPECGEAPAPLGCDDPGTCSQGPAIR